MKTRFITADVARSLMEESKRESFVAAPFYTLMFENIRTEAKQGYMHLYIDIREYEYVLNKSLTHAARVHLMDNMIALAVKKGFKCSTVCSDGEYVFKVSWAE